MLQQFSNLGAIILLLKTLFEDVNLSGRCTSNTWRLCVMCRLMTPPNNLTSEEKAIICSQRMLDATLKNISLSPTTINSTRAYYAVYFGSIEGVQRYFPGLVRPHSKISEIIFS